MLLSITQMQINTLQHSEILITSLSMALRFYSGVKIGQALLYSH